MGVSFEEEYENSLDKKANKSMNATSDKKRSASRDVRKKFKTFDKPENDDAFDFLKKYSKNGREIEGEEEEEPRESKRSKSRPRREEGEHRSRTEEARMRRSDSDFKSRKNDFRSKPKKNHDEDEEEDDGENEFKFRKGDSEGKSKGDDDDFRFKSEDNFRPRTADNEKKKLKPTGSFDSKAKYLDIHQGSGENALEELLQVGSQQVRLQENTKRESSGWNISDDDMEEYMRAKNYYKRKDSEEGFSIGSSGLYWGAASLLAAGVTMAYVKNKFFS